MYIFDEKSEINQVYNECITVPSFCCMFDDIIRDLDSTGHIDVVVVRHVIL